MAIREAYSRSKRTHGFRAIFGKTGKFANPGHVSLSLGNKKIVVREHLDMRRALSCSFFKWLSRKRIPVPNEHMDFEQFWKNWLQAIRLQAPNWNEITPAPELLIELKTLRVISESVDRQVSSMLDSESLDRRGPSLVFSWIYVFLSWVDFVWWDFHFLKKKHKIFSALRESFLYPFDLVLKMTRRAFLL